MQGNRLSANPIPNSSPSPNPNGAPHLTLTLTLTLGNRLTLTLTLTLGNRFSGAWSPISPLYLPYISPISPPYLATRCAALGVGRLAHEASLLQPRLQPAHLGREM